jgi:hypothetical protein
MKGFLSAYFLLSSIVISSFSFKFPRFYYLGRHSSLFQSKESNNLNKPNSNERKLQSLKNNAVNSVTNRISQNNLVREIDNISKQAANLARSNSRRKMGPPQRKLKVHDEDKVSGRVSVYCVGSEIDIQALRVHVFRRGFGNNKLQSTTTTITNSSSSTTETLSSTIIPELTLSRRPEDIDLDDEVLHVSNAPLFIAADNKLFNIWNENGDFWESIANRNTISMKEADSMILGDDGEMKDTFKDTSTPTSHIQQYQPENASSSLTSSTSNEEDIESENSHEEDENDHLTQKRKSLQQSSSSTTQSNNNNHNHKNHPSSSSSSSTTQLSSKTKEMLVMATQVSFYSFISLLFTLYFVCY